MTPGEITVDTTHPAVMLDPRIYAFGDRVCFSIYVDHGNRDAPMDLENIGCINIEVGEAHFRFFVGMAQAWLAERERQRREALPHVRLLARPRAMDTKPI